MNCRVLVAGWPFAGLLALSARRLDPESSATCRSGVVTESDGRRGSLVIEPGDVAGLIEIDEITTASTGWTAIPSRWPTFASVTSSKRSRKSAVRG